MKYRVLIEQDEDGIYVIEVPSLPGCISQGKTRKDALENIKEAITVYLESLEAHNEPDHREVAKGTLRSIIHQAGLTVEEFRQLL